MPETKSYSGSCHCGAVAYDVDLDVSGALKCNCSICEKLGAVWAFAPRTQFKLKSGEGALGDYQFGKKHLHHRHCTKCGIETFAEGAMPDGTPTVGINLRCIDGMEVDKLSPKLWDGRSK
jgi:hypothetical protein